MNWILRKSNKLSYHTNLTEIVKPIVDDIADLNWLVADLEYGGFNGDYLPINMNDDYFILNPVEFKIIANTDLQLYWGVFVGIPSKHQVLVDVENLPFVEGNPLVWKNGNIQHADAVIEIICYDSGYTMVKFTDEELSNKFKTYFTEAIELEKFKNKSAPYY
ncbi:hypothetical protein SAMN05192574_10833 [Mucilaginibacter gossypiicola]|uniref:Uncharacterized protein n=1 Tax=Mucilaginibacter gossypiicola TaxID=551995 RepID=A0A1H8PJU1_9SPHI|nr:hypothetical protein [Mucilaginibacter gossypiicola]SEO41987.1 hypothetical protein SAMN05192574_10833 [Mucilaginibacter gossypiicola]